LPEKLEEPKGKLTSLCRTLLLMALERFGAIEAQIGQAGGWIESIMKQSALCQKIAALPGVGAMTATAMVAAVGDVRFKNGRHLAAWIGLVPRQNSSGGKSRLLGISKRGDAYLRTLLIHGARSVLIRVACKQDARSVWLLELLARRGYNRATVALANKNARIIQSVLSGEDSYHPAAVTG
jgi:transposase